MKSGYKVFFSLVFILGINACKNQSNDPSYSIEPPFKSIPAVYDQFELNPLEPKIIRLASGSSIEVPENAFVDKNGQPVTGTVSLKYREFNSASDIITSGIPMTSTDEQGQVRNFESGGMFELTASSNGQEIAIAPNKKLNVHLASEIEGDFDFYYLEEEDKKNAATASIFTEAKAQGTSAKQFHWKKIYSQKDSSKKETTAKREKNPNAKYFQVHFDTKKYPETVALDTIKWEYAGINKKDDPLDTSNAWVQKELWTRMSVSKPLYYSEMLREIDFIKKGEWVYGTYCMLPDSLGFLAEEDSDCITHYDWKGTAITRFKGVTKIERYFNHGNLIINKSRTRIVLQDQKGKARLYSMNGTFIKNLDFTNEISSIGNGDQVVYQKEGQENEITIAKLTGEIIKKIPIDKFSSWNVSNDENYISIIKNKTLLVLDEDGKTINRLPMNSDDYNFHFINYNNCIYIHNKDMPPSIWDWEKNKIYSSKYNLSDNSHPSILLSEPILLSQSDEEVWHLWNWETNSYKTILEYKGAGLHFSRRGNFIYNTAYEVRQKTYTLLDKDGNVLLKSDSSRSFHFLTSREDDFIIVYGDSSICKVLDKEGKLVLDLKKYDSLSYTAVFTEAGNIISTTKDGQVCLWNTKGKLLRSVFTGKNKIFASSADKKDEHFYISKQGKPLELWDFNNNKALAAFDESLNHYWMDNQNIEVINNYETILTCSNFITIRLWKKTNVLLEPEVYKISLHVEKKEFNSYVKLTAEQFSLIQKHQKYLQARINEEQKRVVEEEKLVRSFQISNFGIYNWDKFYKNTNSLLVKASIDFDTIGTDFNDITLFLITGKDRNVVIKYYKEIWDKFRFDPTDNNKLIAILPGDRIAVFEEEAFRKLDIEKIKKDGSFIFKMKILEGTASKQMLEDLLKKPS